MAHFIVGLAEAGATLVEDRQPLRTKAIAGQGPDQLADAKRSFEQVLACQPVGAHVRQRQRLGPSPVPPGDEKP